MRAAIAGALISGVISYARLGDVVFTEQGLPRLVGNMLGGALAFWGLAWLYRRGEKRA